MNFKKLENNLLDMIQEQQVKIGYMSGVTRFYYPLQSLNRLLGTELTEEEMQHAMEEFSDHACDRLGKVTASSKNVYKPPCFADLSRVGSIILISDLITFLTKSGNPLILEQL